MPRNLAFGAHAGSLLALTGTPVNVIVSDAAADAGVGRFGFLEFGLAGVPLVAGTIAIVWLFGERLLPHRTARSITRDFSDHARTLIEQYRLEHAEDALLTRTSGVAEVVVPPRSELAGERLFPGMVTDSGDLVVLGVQGRGEELPGESILAVGDTLLVLHGTARKARHRGMGGVRRVAGPRPGLECGRDGLFELGQADRGRSRWRSSSPCPEHRERPLGAPAEGHRRTRSGGSTTLLFLAARSMLGFARWRLQRELWRRDVERLASARERETAS